MSVATALQQACEDLGMTQKALARIGNYSPKTISAIKTGRRRLQPELAEKLTKLSPAFAQAVCFACPANLFVTPVLDGDVDLSPLAVTTKLAEELRELADCLERLDLVNKTSPGRLSAEDKQELHRATAEAIDVQGAIITWLVRVAWRFGFNVPAEMAEHRQKLLKHGYVAKEATPHAAR